MLIEEPDPELILSLAVRLLLTSFVHCILQAVEVETCPDGHWCPRSPLFPSHGRHLPAQACHECFPASGVGNGF